MDLDLYSLGGESWKTFGALVALMLRGLENDVFSQIGLVMLVTGLAQLLAAPAVVQLELRIDARLLTAAGLSIFATGLAMSGWQTPAADNDERFWPQVVRVSVGTVAARRPARVRPPVADYCSTLGPEPVRAN